MNTLRNELKSKYSQIPNELITDLSLCHGSLRVLLYLFTKPDDWNVYNKDICKQLSISEQTLTKYWKELLASKWLRREKRPPTDNSLAGGYIYHIGTFSISIESTEKVKSIEHSNNKPINKQETNSEYNYFISDLKSKVKIKTKVSSTKEGRQLFKKIKDIKKLKSDYIAHQLDKKEFSQRITAFMEDYNPVQNNSNMIGKLYTGNIYG